jgi:hypothetical protein
LTECLHLIGVGRLLMLELVDGEGALRELRVDHQHPDEAGREQCGDQQHEWRTRARVSRPDDTKRRRLADGRTRRRGSDR